MEFNKRAEMNETPFLAIGRQSYDIVSPDNEHQAGASAWTPMDFNGVGPSSMNDIWNADWRHYTGDLPHSHSLQAHHRAKRQHFWDTPLVSEQQGVGPSSSEDESMQSAHAELLGCCETANAVNPGFDFFQPTSNPVSTSRAHALPHSLMLVSNSRQAIAANGTGHWNASAPQGAGLGSFFTERGWESNREPLSSEAAESTKGKGVDQFNSNAGGSGIELNVGRDFSQFSSVLVPDLEHTQREKEKENSVGPSDCMPKQRTEEAHGDFRRACKRKLSPADPVEASACEPQLTATNESAVSRVGGCGNSSGETDFTDFYPLSDTSTTTPWGDSCNESTPEYAYIQTHFSRGFMESASGLRGSGEDTTRSLANQSLNMPNDMQPHSQLLFARNYRRFGHSYPFPGRNLQSESSHSVNSTSLLQNSDHWPPLGGEISPVLLPTVSNWRPNGLRRNNSAFSIPGSRDRGCLQGTYEGNRFRSMQGRALDWAMAAASVAAPPPPPTTTEHRVTSQLFPSEGVAIPTGNEVDLPGPSARITQAATPFFNSGVLASYFPASGSDAPRVSINPPQPVSSAPGHNILPGPPLEAYASVPGQAVGRSVSLSPSRGRRDALFSSPVQSLLGLPFRGLHTLRADGEYRRQFLSEILNAMHHAFRSEDLNFEELVMLDPSMVYGDVHDQHRDMRLDVDNMSYEELLALEERIGNVSTGLDEEKISLCLRESKYSSLDATVAAISQDSDIKCSVCQEEFVEDDELGRLDCGHGYHSACIRQWLLQKNECPICKASPYTKP